MAEPRVKFASGGIMNVAPEDRRAADFDPTPPSATAAFALEEASALSAFPAVWEPAAGDGQMVDVLRRLGVPVRASDLVDRGRGFERLDFLRPDGRPRSRAVVTNPPYSLCNDGSWFAAARDWGLDYMALLLPLAFFATRRGLDMFRADPPSRLLLLSWKVDFKAQGAPPGNHHWAVWDRAAPRDGCRVRVLARPEGFANTPRLDAPRPTVAEART